MKRCYDAMPQAVDVLTRDGQPALMGLEELVIGLLRYEVNCLEWAGRPIDSRAPRMVPDGYRYDRWNDVYVPKGFSFCRRCQKIKPVGSFGKDKRNRGREHTRSWCSNCEAQDKTLKNRQKAAAKHNHWKRG